MTGNGWKNIKNVTKEDYVYTMNPDTKEAGYQPVTGLVKVYADKMIRFNGKSIDLLVTDEHKMFLYGEKGYEFRFAKDLKNSQP